jgi:multicomponent Na+:H+ antiporter subunit B
MRESSRVSMACGIVLALVAGVVPPLFSPGAGGTSVRFGGKSLRKTEVLGLLIFVFMAVVMFAVGTALFCDWLTGSGTAPAGMPVDLGPIAGLNIVGTVPTMAIVFGVEVVGGLSIIMLYMLSSARRSG